MIKDPDEIKEGQVVHLVPHTKQASRTCFRKLAVTIDAPPKKHWPRLLVKWSENDGAHFEMVHKDNVRINPPSAAKTREGDATRDSSGSNSAQVRKVRRVLKPIVIPDGMEQGELF